MSIKKIFTANLIYIIVFLLFSEYYLRYKGYDGTKAKIIDFKEEADNCLNKFSFSEDNNIRNILITGCSFTYGVGVSKEQNYVSLLNELLPQYKFHNAGVKGLGAGQSLVTVERALKKKHYNLVIYATIANHLYRDEDIRISLDSSKNKNEYILSKQLIPNIVVPIELEGNIRKLTCYWDTQLWLAEDKLSSINFIHNIWNRWLYSRLSEIVGKENSKYIRFCYMVRAMDTICKQNGTKFAVANLYGFNFDKSNYILTTNPMSLEEIFTTKLTSRDIPPKITNWDVSYPRDIMTNDELHTKPCFSDRGDHPSPIVHKYYAQHLAKQIKELNI